MKTGFEGQVWHFESKQVPVFDWDRGSMERYQNTVVIREGLAEQSRITGEIRAEVIEYNGNLRDESEGTEFMYDGY